MHTTKSTTPKALQIKLQLEGGTANNGVGESSRALYYGNTSAGSVPFMWESQPGTPKYAFSESSLPPLTPPPSYNQFANKYNSSMQMINHAPKSSGFLRAIFISSSRKRNMKGAPPSSFSYYSGSCSSSSSSSQSTPMRKVDGWRRTSVVKFGSEEDERGGGSPTSTLCLGGGFKKGCRIKKAKKAMLSFVCNGKAS